MADWGFPVDRWELQKIVRHYVSTCGQASQFKKGFPGEGFISGFITRHRKELQLRLVSNYSHKRASVSSVVLNQYFDHLEKSLEGVPLQNIFNYDETNLPDNPGMKKCLVRRGNKYPSRIMNIKRSNFDYVLWKRSGRTFTPLRLLQVQIKKSLVRGALVVPNEPHTEDQNLDGLKWPHLKTVFFSIALPQLKKLIGPKALMGDNLSSHMSVKVIAACKQNDIRFICLPPNATDFLQPLDVAFFGPLKREWRKILSAYKNDFPSESAVRKDKFPQLLKILIDRATATSDVNLQNGFKKCLSRDAVLAEKKFEVAEVQINSVVNQALLDVLQTKRFGNKLRTVKRNKEAFHTTR